jgi:hypothetical protein
MTRQFTTFYCQRCGQNRRFTRRCTDGRRHLVATIVTFGLWGIVWLVLRRRDAARPWHCCICSTNQKPTDEPPEARELREQRKKQVTIPIQPRSSIWK